MNRTHIPQTDSIQELAHFWDTHDLTDFSDELEEVSEPVFERQTVVTVHSQASNMNGKVFISYSSVDDKRAKQLAKILDEINVEYFLDRKDINWGDDVTERITQGLADCSALVVIISPASLKSQWVPFEIGHASGLGKKILPFLTHPSLDVPGYLQRFHYETRLADVKKYFQSLFAPPPVKKSVSKSGTKVSPKERDAIRKERNEMLEDALTNFRY